MRTVFCMKFIWDWFLWNHFISDHQFQSSNFGFGVHYKPYYAQLTCLLWWIIVPIPQMLPIQSPNILNYPLSAAERFFSRQLNLRRPPQPPTVSETGNDVLQLASKGRYSSFRLWMHVSVTDKTMWSLVNTCRTWVRLWKKTARHVNWTGRMPWIVTDGGSR